MRQNKLQGEKVQMRPQNLDAPYPPNALGVIFLGVIFDGCGSVKCLGAVDP